ncbi:MAG TPA: fibronectin type III domain-containing protein, partial [Longimicrobium sp.]|nr:fibronectin type III domain-containing protein [Longimicrobium sp.]
TYFVMLRGYSPYTGVTLTATVTGPPVVAPGSLAGTAVSMSRINLAWVDASTNESSFAIERRAKPAGGDTTWSAWAHLLTRGANSRGAVDSIGVTAGLTHQYRIRACNTGGCSAWAYSPGVTTPFPTVAPPPPAALAATSTATLINLSWAHSSPLESSFKLQRRRRISGSTWTAYQDAATLGPNAASYTDTATVGQEYAYRIRPCNAIGCAAWVLSPVISLRTVPTAPTAISARVTTLHRIDLDWTDASTNETGFRLSRRSRVPGGAWGAFALIATVAPNTVAPPVAVTFADSAGVVVGLEYQYRVQACNTSLCSAYATSPGVVAPALPPGAPGFLGATVIGSTRIDLAWMDASASENGFNLQRRKRNADGTWQPYQNVVTTGPNTIFYSNTGLSPASTYTYRVRACNAAGCSAFVTGANVTTP